jgi:NifB/MoaA-like Fe-S oxidoreductase
VLERIRIAATTAHLPEETREMLREVKAVRAKLREDGVVKPPIPSPPIEKPHPAIAPTARTLRKAKADARSPGISSKKV